MKNGVSAELAKLTAHDPSYTYAVVFDAVWHPLMPPEGEQWTYIPCRLRPEAEELIQEPQSEQFADPELWERDKDGWSRVA